MRRSGLRFLILLLLVGVAAGGWYLYRRYTAAPKVSFRFGAAKRGDLLATISATGTVEPEEVIDVGAQVAGQINTFGKDANDNMVDYRSPVKKGTLLVQIDDTLYAADRDNAQAALDSAKIGVDKAQADLNQAQANAVKAGRDWDRAQKLGPSDALSQSDYDTYESAAETTKAAVAVSQAALAQSKAAVTQADAALNKAKQNVAYCTISSPVDGVIIDRRVNTGQTVVSSLNAPSLFLIAKDLTKMQVWVAVNEADIGNIVPGKPVTFTVDAFPNRTFHGSVGKVRLNAQMTQNVVTYTVEVVTDNSDGTLLPYLTANVQFEVSRLHEALLVPNAALRFEPATDQIAPDARAAATGRGNRGGTTPPDTEPATRDLPPAATVPSVIASASTTEPSGPTTRPHGRGRSRNGPGGAEGNMVWTRGRVWVREGEFVRPIRVRVGPTDGLNTAVEGDEIKDGMEIVLGEQHADAARPEGTTNPFAPQMPRGGRPGGGGSGGGGSGGGSSGGGGGGGGPGR